MSTYTWLKLVHIASAIVAVGTNVTYVVWLLRARRDPGHDLFTLQGIQTLDNRVANPAYVVLPITGILMVLDADLGFSTFWIALAIGLYVLVALFGALLFAPALRRQIRVVESEGVASEAYAAAASRTALLGAVTMAPVVGILYLMVMKPTL